MAEKEQQYVLFYSNKCAESQKFIKLLQEYPDVNSNFKKIEISQLSRQQIPPQLKFVPGVVSNNQLMMGANAFKWLKETASKCLVPGPELNSKGGFHTTGFSFIGDEDSNFNPNYSPWGGDNNNGSMVDPNKFDQKSGKPKEQETDNSLPSALQPMKIENGSKFSDNDYSRIQQSRDQEIQIPKRRT